MKRTEAIGQGGPADPTGQDELTDSAEQGGPASLTEQDGPGGATKQGGPTGPTEQGGPDGLMKQDGPGSATEQGVLGDTTVRDRPAEPSDHAPPEQLLAEPQGPALVGSGVPDQSEANADQGTSRQLGGTETSHPQGSTVGSHQREEDVAASQEPDLAGAQEGYAGRGAPGRLPGDPTPRETLERMVRVDHAGEYGAGRIYAGQLAILGRGDKAEILRHMKAQEQVHLDTFSALVAKRRVRPTALLPLWHVAGFALGAATAAMGERAAMACTVAVEEAIDEHYASQIEQLGDDETELKATIVKFRDEELEHRDIGLEHGAERAVGYRLLRSVIKVGCRVAIRVSERI